MTVGFPSQRASKVNFFHDMTSSLVLHLNPLYNLSRVGVTKALFFNLSVRKIFDLATLLQNRIHIWQVSPQLSCGDTCQIWLSYAIPNMCFENGEKSGKKKRMEEIILATFNYSSYTRNNNALSVLYAMLVFLFAVCTRDSPCDKDCCGSVFVMNYYRGRSGWWASVFVMNYYRGRSWWWASVFVMNYYRGRSGRWAYLSRLFPACIIHPKNNGLSSHFVVFCCVWW